MKTFKSILLAIAMLLCNISASAHSFEVGGILYSTTPSGVTVTYKGGSALSAAYKGDIVIPSSVEYDGSTYSVTSIGDYAFYGCSGLTSITIPNSVTSIGFYVFRGCSGLTSICVDEGNTVYDSRKIVMQLFKRKRVN